jgi:hypothetical protein
MLEINKHPIFNFNPLIVVPRYTYLSAIIIMNMTVHTPKLRIAETASASARVTKATWNLTKVKPSANNSKK